MILIFILILLGLWFHLEPNFDILPNGDWIIWYNSDRRTKTRTSKIIKWNK